MKVKKNIKLSKRLLFTSLAAVALLGATQPVSAEMYTSRNFDWSGDDWSGDDWSGDDWSGDGLSKYDRSGDGLSKYGWSKYGWSSDEDDWSSDENDWPHDWSSDEDDWSSDEDDWSSDENDWPHDWFSGKKDETEDKVRPPYGEALGTGYEGSDWGGPGTVPTDPYTPPYGGALGTGYEGSDWGGPGTVPTDPYTPPYGGALGTGYEGSDWGGPGHISQPNQHQQSQKPSPIPEPPHSDWPERDPNFGGLSFGHSSDWGRSEDTTPHFPSGPRMPENPQHTPQNNPQVSDYDKGLSDGLKAKESGSGIDFVGFQYGGWSEDYKKGYMAGFGTPYTPSTT
ncbi:lysis inhibitor protein [Streptococcus pyogenes]|uniref:lysis inhibitor protein n=1 Tax=Streptococcus pyogenes TaxID=1314 RepID=UPI0010A16EDE|nr:lysis inhibitor protein [Streptococcus pyogenes]VHH88756.1 sic family protein [Streptococcus pyogenes]